MGWQLATKRARQRLLAPGVTGRIPRSKQVRISENRLRLGGGGGSFSSILHRRGITATSIPAYTGPESVQRIYCLAVLHLTPTAARPRARSISCAARGPRERDCVAHVGQPRHIRNRAFEAEPEAR